MWRPGDEPIPGYHLQQFLGRGNFGEVWKARAPGGTSAALKFLDLSGKNGIREFRGVARVKGIKHANLMPITAIWMLDENGELVDDRQLRDYDPQREGARDTADVATETLAVERSAPRAGCLVVAMLAGDMNLTERLEQCQEEDLPGIPVDELLGYMEEAAKGLDRLNLFEHDLGEGLTRIQHCDVKPANMMLVGGTVLICDFGLAQVLGDSHVTQSITGSPAFMAPECFERDGASPNRDQYALAIAYHELRTGELPFDDESYDAVRQAHAKGKLNLSRLPPAEQAVMRRATSVRPGDRYPSSSDMVQALKQAVQDEDRGPGNTRFARAASFGVLAVGLLVAAAIAVWRAYPMPQSAELSFQPPDCQVQINGQAADLHEGKLQVTLRDDSALAVRATHPSGNYEELDQRYTKADLHRLGYTLSLRRLVQLQFQPKDSRVQIDGTERTLQAGKLKLPLDPNQSVRIRASHDSGWYQDVDRQFSTDELARQGFAVTLDPTARYHANAAFRLYDTGEFAKACDQFRKAIALGVDTSVRSFDVAQHAAGAVRLVTISPNGRWLAAVSKDAETVSLWDLATEDPAAASYPLRGHDDLVNCARFCRDGHRLLTAGRDKMIRLWDLSLASSSMAPRTIGQQEDDVVSLALGPDDHWIASASFSGAIQQWGLQEQPSGQPLGTLQHVVEIREIKTDPTGRWLVAWCEDGQLYQWDLNAARPPATLRKLTTPEMEVKCQAFTTDGHQLVAGASGGSLCVWDMDQNQPAQTRAAHGDDIESLAIGPVGKRLVTGGSDHEVRLWDLSDLMEGEPRILLGHDQLVSAVSIGSRGRWVVTGSWDKTIRVWDTKAANPGATCIVLSDLADRVRSVAISPDGRWLVACGSDGRALLWDSPAVAPGATI